MSRGFGCGGFGNSWIIIIIIIILLFFMIDEDSGISG
jgi:Na+/melibiose symporter-like transporter